LNNRNADVALQRSGIRVIANTPTLFYSIRFSVVQYGLLVRWFIGGRKNHGEGSVFFLTRKLRNSQKTIRHISIIRVQRRGN
jgi:hypothetical protein